MAPPNGCECHFSQEAQRATRDPQLIIPNEVSLRDSPLPVIPSEVSLRTQSRNLDAERTTYCHSERSEPANEVEESCR